MKQEPKSQYMLFFRGEHWDKGLSPEQLQQTLNSVMTWFDNLQQQGKVKAGQPLAPEGRFIAGSKRTVSDGPFAESKEAVGGYLLLEVSNFEEAIAVAKSCPTLDLGITIEVRPVLDECPVFKRAQERLTLANA